MAERYRPARATLLAIELLIAVGIFTFCAVVCMGIFVRAEKISRENEELNLAVNEARNVAECFRAAEGDLETAAKLCGASIADGTLALQDETSEVTVYLTARQEDGYILGELTARRGDEDLFVWTIAAAEAAP